MSGGVDGGCGGGKNGRGGEVDPWRWLEVGMEGVGVGVGGGSGGSGGGGGWW